MTRPPRIAVTGATGFVGRHLVDHAKLRGTPVQGLSRQNAPDLRTGTARDWAAALQGVDCCIHLAGALPGATPDDLNRANVDGSRSLLQGTALAGVSHLIFVSSIGVVGYYTTPQTGPLSPQSPVCPDSAYARSKAEAEEMLTKEAQATGQKLTILRPPLVYGPASQGSFAALVRLIDKAPVLPFGGVQSRRDLVGVRNLSDCLLTLAEENLAGLFHVRDRDTVSMTGLVEQIIAAHDWQRRLITLPEPLRRMAMTLPGLKPKARRLFGDIEIDDTTLQAQSSWVPPFSLAQEIAFSAQARNGDAQT